MGRRALLRRRFNNHRVLAVEDRRHVVAGTGLVGDGPPGLAVGRGPAPDGVA
ncbi:MAG: hypothetical protein M5U28_46555 [Sandaracinaceae bacterium]|nr:hypothetical protein [Sandaracinaceae bacterium]